VLSLYDAAEGFSPDGITSVTQPFRDPRGRLWFPTLNGVSMVDPVQVKPTSSPSWAVIEWIKADDVYHFPDDTGRLSLGPGVRRLTFQFVGFGSDAPEKQEYQVKLEGFDRDWFRLGSTREHAYTNLKPGNYHFRVRVANRDGIVSERGADVWVELKARYYQTRVFQAGVVSVTVALLLGIFLLRIRYLRNDRHRLARLVEQRTKEWEEAASAARQANESKSRFLAMVSHEVRTPMNGIIGLTDLLMDTPMDEQQRTYMELVQSSSLSLLQLLNDLLDWSKIESGKLVIEQISLDLHGLLGDCERLLKPQFDQKGLQLSMEIAADIPHGLIGDPLRVRQIILNLLSNGLKFTNSGRVGVSVRVEGQERDPCTLHFEVSDTGIGLSQDAIQRLFVDYSQADASISRTHGGTGLGLSICKTLVELMGGRIWVVSKLGDGAVFHFQIPFTCAKDARGQGGSDQCFMNLLWEESQEKRKEDLEPPASLKDTKHGGIVCTRI
jgi:signal transduction histidine kinase